MPNSLQKRKINMKSLNGWQRLWVLVSVIYMIGVFCIGYMSRSSIENYDTVHSFLFDSVLVPKEFHSPYTQQESAIMNKWHAETKQANIPVLQEYKESRNKFIFYTCLAALTPSVILYGFGFGIAWVKKGFQKNNDLLPPTNNLK